MAMGSLALAMIGIICLAPVLANLLRPVVVPLYQALGADPAMFAGTLLANDMGAPLAQELALTQEAGQFGGLIVGSMLGPTIVFTIPVGLGIIKAEDRPYLPPACWRASSPSPSAASRAAWRQASRWGWCCAT